MMVQEFAAGAVEAGASFQNIPLVTKEIKTCISCGACFYKTPGKCVLEDDMSELIKKFMASDIVVFATPVYIDNVTSLMKIFIDRLMPVLEPHYKKDSRGEYRRANRFRKYPRLVAISSCALPEHSNFQVLRLFFRRMARTMHSELVGEIYRGASGVLLLCKDELQFKPQVEGYKKLLRSAGEELVKTGRISADTAAKLEAPLIEADQYVNYANRIWDQMLETRSAVKVYG